MIFTTQPCFSNKKIDRPNPLERQTKKTNMETIYQVKIFALRLLTQNYFFYSYNDTNHKKTQNGFCRFASAFYGKDKRRAEGIASVRRLVDREDTRSEGKIMVYCMADCWPLCRRCKFFRRNNLDSKPCRQLRQPRFTQRSKSSLPLRLSSCSLLQD